MRRLQYFASFSTRLLILPGLLTFLGSTPSLAEVNRPIAGKHDTVEIIGACDKAKGKVDVSTDKSTFSCTKQNCDGKGGTCSVTCTFSGHDCFGTTPAILPVANITLLMLLQNGSNVNHSYSDSGASNTPNHPNDTGTPKQGGGQVGGPSFQ